MRRFIGFCTLAGFLVVYKNKTLSYTKSYNVHKKLIKYKQKGEIYLTASKRNLQQKQKTSKLLEGWSQIKKSKFLLLLILPGLIYYIVFQYVPMYGLLIAFKDFDARLGILGSPWVGLTHFKKFLDHPDFFRLVKNTVVLNVYQLLFVFPLPIIFALLLNEIRNATYKRIVQTVSYLPHFISMVAIVGMMMVFLSPSEGIVNIILQKLGFEPIYFMAESGWFRPLYILSEIWTTLGWSAIIYISALSSVDMEIYESAVIDGATRLQLMRHISLPSILPTVVIMLIMSIGNLMSLGSEKVLLMQQPITYEVSDVISTFVYRRGLEFGEYSFSTAVSIFNSVINIALLATANGLAKRLTDNSLW